MRNIDIYPQDKIYSDLVGVWYPAASAGADDEPPVPPVPPTPPTPEVDYFYVKNLNNSENYCNIIRNGNPSTGYNLEYSKDNINWTTCDYEYVSILGQYLCEITLQANEKIYFRSTSGLSQNSTNYYNFRTDGEIGGDVRTLIDYTNMGNTLQSYCFYHLFADSYISTNNLDFSHVSVLNNSCFEGMYINCYQMTSHPSLPATTLSESCYKQMFMRSGLTTAPALPATVLTANCYREMFNGCASLVTPPALPATTLASNCYADMFGSCTSISGSVTLPATTVVDGCYSGMFNGSSIDAVTMQATNTAQGAYDSMFIFASDITSITTNTTEWNTSDADRFSYGINTVGTFYNNGCADIHVGDSGIPYGWTEVKSNCPEPPTPPTPPTPPMPTPPTPTEGFFYIENTHDGGNNITLTANENPQSMSFIEYSRDGEGWEPVNFEQTGENIAVFAVNLDNPGDKVYFRSAQGWSDTYAPDEAHTGYYYFNGDQPHKCGGDIRTLYDWSRDDVNEVNADCFFGLFQSDNNLTDASELNLSHITTMSANCYMAMFGSCTSLVAAPNIYATPSATDCYSSMFRGCSSLDRIYSLATSWDAQNTSGWLSETTGGTVYNIGGASGIEVPNNWTVVSE